MFPKCVHAKRALMMQGIMHDISGTREDIQKKKTPFLFSLNSL